MIKVQQLTKRFAGCTAVDGVSFEVARGEIVGFLGPNGAGKTTTMRILAGYLPASGGSASIAGHDVFRDSIEVRRRIGYLPENVPLYPEMRVDEYLHFRARLKGVHGPQRRQRVEEVKGMCGLGDVGRRIIGQLSKGYRQRVGLAESLVHDPELLILDEPTIGLDPNQIRQVRELIKDLAQRHTVLLSTHILPEVEMTCRRVVIINRGRVVASDTPENLRKLREGGGDVVAEIAGPAGDVKAKIGLLPGVKSVALAEADGWCRVVIECEQESALRPALFEAVARAGWGLRELRTQRRSLEDVFVSLTQADAEGRVP